MLLLAFLLHRFPPSSWGLVCGYPGAPAHGRPHPLKELYNPGEHVTYSCSRGYSQRGPLQRTCLQNGTWSPTWMPLCDVSLPTGQQHAFSRQTLSLYPANKSIDGDPGSCTYTDKLRPRWIRIDLGESRRVEAVALTLPRDLHSQGVVQLSVYAISVRDSTTASYQKCASFSGKFASATLKVLCSGGDTEGRYIHVEDDRSRVDYFSLCEIQVYVARDSYECGEAERPAHGYSARTEREAVHYRCIHGYRLEGPHTRMCLKRHGQWSLHPPACIEIACPPLGEVEHGQVSYSGPLTLDATANVTCDYGYQMSGSAKVCGQDGRWSEGDLSCQPLKCPDQHTLVNGSGEYGSVALLRCGHVVVCREDGTWSHAQCNGSLSRLVIDEQSDVPTGIIAGMTAMVFLLLLAVIFILLIKRKKLLREQHPLPSKEEATCENDTFYATIPVNQDTGVPIDLMSTVLFTRSADTCEEGPIYAQVDFSEKRRSRMRKSAAVLDPPDPAPDDVTYASLSVPLDPPGGSDDATSKEFP